MQLQASYWAGNRRVKVQGASYLGQRLRYADHFAHAKSLLRGVPLGNMVWLPIRARGVLSTMHTQLPCVTMVVERAILHGVCDL